MSNVNAVIEKLGLRGVTSVNHAVCAVTDYMDGKDLGSAANSLIVELGGEPESNHPVEADIVLKAMVELIIKGQFNDPKEAQAEGHRKVALIRKKMPYIFTVAEAPGTTTNEDGTVVQKRSKGEKNDKNAKSLAFVQAKFKEGITDRGQMTNLLAQELETDYAGAYFYVKKSEKALKIELSATKGRKKAQVAE
jgi:hypothetical protein